METIPILKIDDLLLVTIQVDMHDRLALALQDSLTRRISESQARGVMIDISALDTLDTFMGRMLADIAAMARVLGTKVVVVGMRPSVALTLVELGMLLDGVETAIDVDRGLAHLRRHDSESNVRRSYFS